MWQQALGSAMSLGASLINNHLAQQRESIAREENYTYNEKSAENAYNRQKQLLNEYYTPQAQIQQLKDAGLSPSLMYGGAGTTGTASTAQGAGASGISPSYQPINPLIGAQIANINADTAKKQAETENVQANTETEKGENARGAAEIEKMLGENGLNKAKQIFTESQNTAQVLINEINNEEREFIASEIQYRSELLCNQAGYYNELIAKTNMEYRFEKDSYKDRIEEIKKNNLEIASRILLNEEKTNLTAAQQVELEAHVTEIFEKLKLYAEEVAIKNKEAKTHQLQFKLNMTELQQKYALEWQKFKTDFAKFELQLKQEDFKIYMNFIQALLGDATKYATSMNPKTVVNKQYEIYK